MSEPCSCTPGSHEDGWQERRCEPCIQAEMKIWGHVIAWARNGDIVKRLRSKGGAA